MSRPSHTRQLVLERLRATGPAGVSGEALADECRVSRVAVAKHIAALREAGYEIEARHGVGYVLRSVPAHVTPDEVGFLATGRFASLLSGEIEVSSTNDEARIRAEKGAAEGTAFVAARQTSGRGRLGRTWASPDGGVYLSVVLRPPVPPSEAGSLSLAVSAAVARALSGFGIPVSVKWPNDVLVNGRKIAGVLLEMSAEADRIAWVVAGVGINVERPREPFADAAYASEWTDASSAHVAASVLDGIEETYTAWCAQGFSSVHDEYESLSALTGADVTVRDAFGAIRGAGVVLGVDGEGRLLLAGEAGPIAVSSGEVTLRA